MKTLLSFHAPTITSIDIFVMLFIILQTPLDSDSDSSEIGSELIKSNFTGAATTASSQRQQQQAAVKHLLKNNPKMTSLESVVGALASMNGIPAVPGLSSFYPSTYKITHSRVLISISAISMSRRDRIFVPIYYEHGPLTCLLSDLESFRFVASVYTESAAAGGERRRRQQQ